MILVLLLFLAILAGSSQSYLHRNRLLSRHASLFCAPEDVEPYRRLTEESLEAYNALASEAYYDIEESATVYESNYCAAAGLESMLVSLGNARPLISTEYEVAFGRFPALAQLALKHLDPDSTIQSRSSASASSPSSSSSSIGDLSGIWPNRRLESDELESIRRYNESKSNEPKVELLYELLYEDLYNRLDNADDISTVLVCYQNCLRASLMADDEQSTQYAVNAMQSRGVCIEKHVAHGKHVITDTAERSPQNENSSKCMVYLNLRSLWTEALISIDPAVHRTSQPVEGRRAIQDVMMGVMRIALKHVFTLYPNASIVGVEYPTIGSRFEPSEIAVKLYMSSYHRLQQEPGEEAGADIVRLVQDGSTGGFESEEEERKVYYVSR